MARNRAWADTLLSNAIATPGTLNINLLTNAPTVDTLTAVRIVGHVIIVPDAELSAVDGSQNVDIGIGVTSVEAFGANTLPDANDDTKYPPRGWLWIDRFTMMIAVGAGPIDRYQFTDYHFDVRSQRKVDKGVLFMTIQNVVASGGGNAVQVSGRIRVLCLT